MSGTAATPPLEPRAVEGGLKARSTRGAIGADLVVRAVPRRAGVLRAWAAGCTRGRNYARKGQVISLDVDAGRGDGAGAGLAAAARTRCAIGFAPLRRRRSGPRSSSALADQALYRAQAAGRRDAAGDRGDLRRRRRCRCSRRVAAICDGLQLPGLGGAVQAHRRDVLPAGRGVRRRPVRILPWRGRDREDLLADLRAARSDDRSAAAAPRGRARRSPTALTPFSGPQRPEHQTPASGRGWFCARPASPDRCHGARAGADRVA